MHYKKVDASIDVVVHLGCSCVLGVAGETRDAGERPVGAGLMTFHPANPVNIHPGP